MSILDSAAISRSYSFSDIRPNDTFWVTSNRQHPHHCLAKFGTLNEDGVSRDFDCLNGAWSGTLTEKEEGALELHVHKTGTRHFVYLAERIEQPKAEPSAPEEEIAF